MKLQVNIKKNTFFHRNVWAVNMHAPSRSTKDSVVREITSGAGFARAYSRYYDAHSKYCDLTISSNKTVRVYSLEKRRKKVQLVTDKKLLAKGIKRVVLAPSHWIATYYDIPVELLKLAGLKVQQGNRTWEFVKAEGKQ